MFTALAGKADSLRHSYRLTRDRLPLPCEPDPRFRGELERRLFSGPPSGSSSGMTREDGRILAAIRDETAAFNRNNVARTAAYWKIYAANPELHWAFLAHMVSRNGGWNMTDLKGQWLPRLLDHRLAEAIFELMEACNSLIFGDAYPQLRLYEESKRAGRSLFGLLPEFGVSAFMAPFWDVFLAERRPIPLTEALIVNEQHFIQARVVEDPYFKRNAFETPAFRSQPLLQTNQLVVPLWRGGHAGNAKPMRLAGRVIERFEDIRERIEFGKCLYALLFGYPRLLRAAASFARHVPHTGSRADYWPHRFQTRDRGKNGAPDLSESAVTAKWFSPSLEEAWPDRPVRPPTEGDWFRSMDALDYVGTIRLPKVVDMTHEHLAGQYKLQETALLERSFMKGASRRRTGLG